MEVDFDPMVKNLIESNALLVRQLEAKQKRIDYLEMVLNQRYIETRRAYNPDKINEMMEKVYLLWLDGPQGVGFNYEEAGDEFYRRYGFRSASVDSRMRDLRKQGRLWSKEENDKVTFYLTLKGK